MNRKVLKIVTETFFLILIYGSGLYFRLLPRLDQDPHLLTFEADIWYRLCMAQNLMDHGHLPQDDIRYEAYGGNSSASPLHKTDHPAQNSQSVPLTQNGKVPFWYPPFSLYIFVWLSKISGWDLSTVSSRIIPFLESFVPLGFYFFSRFLMGRKVAFLATLFLALTPSFVFWSGISDPQSFTLLMIPLILLIWIKHALRYQSEEVRKVSKYLRILLVGGLLALCFFVHLSFFLIPCFLFPITLGLLFKKMTRPRIFFDLLLALGLSQILTVGWWGPQHLYWWWTQSITTSSANHIPTKQLMDYGMVAGIVGIYFLTLLFIKMFSRKKEDTTWNWLPLIWAFLPLLETQNEHILKLLGRVDLSWSTLFKPLEGFRFFCFLAQPLAFGFGIISSQTLKKLGGKRAIFMSIIPLIFILMFADMHFIYNFERRIKNAGFTIDEIEAAQWFRTHSKPTDRIIADYYRAQMFSGFSGGKALEGMAFPLRNVHLPYISQHNYIVAKDVYKIYTTSIPEEAISLMKRYGATHLFISQNMGNNGNFLNKKWGVTYNFDTLHNSKYFRAIYQKEGKVVILKRIV
ncbi:MAG: hypothetical protein HYS07_03090 [Chlamydiae bacterium]|nr:hypothetical protein [Chlamydiota bacterium]MBI3277173.1 hypothetical protein [Chlamydiota bacterium]